MTRTRILKAAVWSGPAFLVLYLIFFWGVAGFVPPPGPSHSSVWVAEFFDAHRTGIRVGQIGGLVASTLLFPFFGVISLEIARIEGRAPILAMVQFAGAILLIVFFAMCSMLWVAATFREELDGVSVRLLNDTAWLIFVMVFPAYVLQMFCMAIAGFTDRSPTPTWPRWSAYFNLWVGVAGAGGGIAVFFKTGPFAWNGLVGFFIPISVFVIWLVVTTTLLLRSIDRQDLDAGAGADVDLDEPAPAAPFTPARMAASA
jgi:hypothetical protein